MSIFPVRSGWGRTGGELPVWLTVLVDGDYVGFCFRAKRVSNKSLPRRPPPTPDYHSPDQLIARFKLANATDELG